jgi:signal transduction histidine kinase
VLSVSNTGQILNNNINSSLMPDFQLEKQPKIRFGGVGISLFLISKIISQYKGKIWMHNQPEQGTTVTITLPISD